MNRWAQAYVLAAISLLTTLVLFALLNALLYVFPSLRSSTAVETPMAYFGLERLRPAYPGWSTADLVRLHDESRVIFQYQPILQFRIKPMSGTYVNVTADGYRRNAPQQGPWPPADDAFNVFLFGGSTMFGWLLPDAETIASQLQDLAGGASCRPAVAIYNFGHPSYISTQEALLFQSLIRAGAAPDLAVFVDGLNEFFFAGELAYTNSLREMMDGSALPHRLGPVVDLPVYHLLRRLRARFHVPPAIDRDAETQLHRRIIAQWLANKRFIESVGRQHAIRTAFVWQPVPVYKYDRTRHFLYEPVEPGEPFPYEEIGRAYELMSAERPALEAPGDFLWLADMQEDVQENLYVDRIHYSARMSRDIAARIVGFLRERRAIPCS